MSIIKTSPKDVTTSQQTSSDAILKTNDDIKLSKNLSNSDPSNINNKPIIQNANNNKYNSNHINSYDIHSTNDGDSVSLPELPKPESSGCAIM